MTKAKTSPVWARGRRRAFVSSTIQIPSSIISAARILCLEQHHRRPGRRLYLAPSHPEPTRIHDRQVACHSLPAGISPNDEFEGMLAVQLIASHNAAMECYRRAMMAEQTLEGRKENLGQANKLYRAHATLLEASSRHRGKGRQKVTVEHVHVDSGGQAVVGNVQGGVLTKAEDQPHALGYAAGERCRAGTRNRKPCQSPPVANGRCRMHGGSSPGAPKGNKKRIQT